ncbi:hypothetical protein RFI_00899 [Reticulomyxa filosa]|uniref:Uncharacterized protein n=1 Tax=Reticulomyxa filosa TaxID=46433 RepID=X6PEQ0_RETFI|nr:hypothetical protein RFI_00899 [Reticulomyxa filosa]|eukprot:ETO36162.1 hypothetical protein RFI_00899 [Reticulomyxa filosa]
MGIKNDKNSDDNDEYYYKQCAEQGIPKDKCPLSQPMGAVFEEEWTWLKAQLASSTANYILVCGHYPIYSIAEHGPTWSLVEKLKPLLLEYQVSAYINGHDHTFEFIQFDSKDEKEDYIAYVTVGGSHTCDSSTAHKVLINIFIFFFFFFTNIKIWFILFIQYKRVYLYVNIYLTFNMCIYIFGLPAHTFLLLFPSLH